MDQFGYYNPNCLYTNIPKNKVYINPNFKRNETHGSKVPISSKQNSVAYINPNFSNVISSQNITQHQSESFKPKIHINPNFFKPQSEPQIAVPCISAITPINTVSSTTKPVQNQFECLQEQPNGTQLNMGNPMSKSRYCLIRKNVDKGKSSAPIANVGTSTVKVNKYKSISLNTIKRELTTDKKSIKKVTEIIHHNILKSKYKINHKATSPKTQNTRFKFVRRSSATLLNLPETKCNVKPRRTSLNHNKLVLKTNIRQTKKIKTALKKNNIPCPLYKKYGKCLRQARGNCEFLHDKKHVSICRKFMKGICHDKQCLLSHDLTDKKMPTCNFYLQGICTKEGCPYLHVKLSDKTKICQDFLKGYCEQGDKCLSRHVNISQQTSTDKALSNNQSTRNLSSQTNRRISSDRVKIRKNKTLETKKIDNNVNVEKVVTKVIVDVNTVTENRYFKDLQTDTNSDEQYNVKPTRCKLGTLPSFIQL